MQIFLSGGRDALFASREAGSDGSTLSLEIQEVKEQFLTINVYLVKR